MGLDNLNGTTYNNCGRGCETKSDWLATVRGRAGYAVDRVLFYGTGGVAFGDVQAAYGNAALQQLDANRLDRRRRHRIRLHAELDRQGRVPLRRSRQSVLRRCELRLFRRRPPTTVSLTENVVRAGINYKFW